MQSQNQNRKSMSDINVTPLVDVMLVLLIIFMVTAPLIQQGVKVDLPQTKAPTIESDDTKLILTITKNRKLFIGDRELPYKKLMPVLKNNQRLQSEKELYIHADRSLNYGFVVDIMARIQEAGITKIGMVTNPKLSPHKRDRRKQ